MHATVMSVGVAFVFPAITLGALWPLGLNGIWLNLLGTSVLSGITGVLLMIGIGKEIKRRRAIKQSDIN